MDKNFNRFRVDGLGFRVSTYPKNGLVQPKLVVRVKPTLAGVVPGLHTWKKVCGLFSTIAVIGREVLKTFGLLHWPTWCA